MNKKLTSTPCIISTSKQSKDTNIYNFLKVIPHLNKVSIHNVLILAQRFAISPDTLALLIHIAAKGGALYYEK